MAMKWQKPQDKEPEFDKKYPLVKTNSINGEWHIGYLDEIKITSTGKEFVWKDYGGNEIENVSQYLNVEPPKNNQ